MDKCIHWCVYNAKWYDKFFLFIYSHKGIRTCIPEKAHLFTDNKKGTFIEVHSSTAINLKLNMCIQNCISITHTCCSREIQNTVTQQVCLHLFIIHVIIILKTSKRQPRTLFLSFQNCTPTTKKVTYTQAGKGAIYVLYLQSNMKDLGDVRRKV